VPAHIPNAAHTPEVARLHILEAYIETLKAENESLKRQLADAEKRSVCETAKAKGAIAEFSAITRRLTARRPALVSCRRRRSRRPYVRGSRAGLRRSPATRRH
jgi:hypothetical protein